MNLPSLARSFAGEIRPAETLRSLVLTSFVFAASAHAQTLSIETPTLDAGTVPRGTQIVKAFVVKNGGTADLEIREVKPACGCMTATFDKKVRPGAEGKITLTIETKSFRGAISKSAVVTSNDPINPQASLIVVANVRGHVTTLPSEALRIQTAVGQSGAAEVTLTSEHPAFHPASATTSEKYLRATLAPGDAPNRWKLVVTTDPAAPAGPLAGSVTIQTGIPDEPQLRLNVSGVVRTADADTGQPKKPVEVALTNADVVKLVAAGLDDEVVVAKVKNASKVQFELSTDALLALKAQNVGKSVVAAMIERDATQASAPATKSPSTAAAEASAPQNPCAGVELMGVFKEDMRPMAPLIVWLAKIRNGTGVTRMVTLQWLNMYAEELQSSVEIGAGQIATLKLAAQEPFQRQPINLKLSSCR